MKPSQENTSINLYSKADHPAVIVSDVFSSGLSKNMLWHSMSLDKLNEILQESVSMQDIQNSQVMILSLHSETSRMVSFRYWIRVLTLLIWMSCRWSL